MNYFEFPPTDDADLRRCFVLICGDLRHLRTILKEIRTDISSFLSVNKNKIFHFLTCTHVYRNCRSHWKNCIG